MDTSEVRSSQAIFGNLPRQNHDSQNTCTYNKNITELKYFLVINYIKYYIKKEITKKSTDFRNEIQRGKIILYRLVANLFQVFISKEQKLMDDQHWRQPEALFSELFFWSVE